MKFFFRQKKQDTHKVAPVFICDLFKQQANKTPGIVAVKYNNISVLYEELYQKADQLSQLLTSRFANDKIIAISTTRNSDMITGLIAILMSGKAYLPLDPDYPEDRLQQIIDDSNITCCLCTDSEKGFFSFLGLTTISVNEIQENVSDVQNSTGKQSLAYILYTSGSTGKPKGVCMGNTALVNLLQWQKKNSSATIGTNTLQFAPLSFDVSFQEIFATLTTGGTLFIIDDDLRLDPFRLLHFIKEENINRIFLPFVALQQLAEIADANTFFPACLTEVMTAGEQLKITPQFVQLFSRIKNSILFNQYGPTEAHVVTQLILKGDPSSWPALPSIGKAIDNTDIYILDEELRLLPHGETGELVISGICLAEGYLNRPDLTAEKFIEWQHPEKGIMRIYRTGDLARFMPDGNIEFLGRRDHQVKIRGFRIELGEVEVALSKIEGVQQVAVVAREDVPGQKRLVAYLAGSLENVTTTSVRQQLQQQLPDYMLPSAIVVVKEFPKTSSGKIDRKALPIPDESLLLQQEEEFIEPKTTIEKLIADIWIELLGIRKISRQANFFELGGNSLIATQVVTKMAQKTGQKLPLTSLLKQPILEKFAALYSNQQRADTTNERAEEAMSGAEMEDRYLPATEPQIELWLSCMLGGEDANRSYTESVSFFVYGKLDVETLAKAVQELAHRHESLRINITDKGNEVCIHPKINADVILNDISSKDLQHQQMLLDDFSKQIAGTSFNLYKDVLFKVALLKLNAEKHYLILIAHHIICDGASLGTLLRELGILYSAYIKGVKPGLLPAPTFSSYTKKENAFYHSDNYKKIEDYWINQYKQSIPKVELPLDYPRPVHRTYKGNRYFLTTNSRLIRNMQKAGSTYGSSFAITLRCAFEIFLYHITKQKDVIVGLPVAGQLVAGPKELVAHSVSLIPVRSRLEEDSTFCDYLQRRKPAILDDYEHYQVTFGSLLKKLNIPRDPSRIPLIPVVLNVTMGMEDGVELEGLTLERVFAPYEYEKFELVVNITGSEKHPIFEWSYNSNLFKETTIKQLAASFDRLLHEIVKNPAIPVSELIQK